MPISESTRRTFIKSSIAASAVLAAPNILGTRALAQGRKFSTVLIGSGWWGTNIAREAARSGRCTIVGLSDVDTRQLDASEAELAKVTADKPKRFADHREMLEELKPDVAIVGSPDHWHALHMIDAVNAGAHVYVEKPISHTIMEGRAMVNAARRMGRVVQVGTHRRISPHNLSGFDFIRSGRVGKVGMVRCFVHYGGGAETPVRNTEPPKELDWDRWCGPAPLRHYSGNQIGGWGGGIHPKGFRNYLDYANGTLGDWGIHWLDQVLWVMDRKAPQTVFSTGGRPIKGEAVYNEREQTSDAPDHQLATYDFEDFSVSWEHRQFAGNKAEKTHPQQAVGCYFYGTEGTFHMGWLDGWTFYPNNPNADVIHEDAQLHAPDDQNIRELWADFMTAIDTGSKPACDIEEIHYSTNMALLGMLSLKHGKSIEWDGEAERCVGDDAANLLLRRDYRDGYEYPTV